MTLRRSVRSRFAAIVPALAAAVRRCLERLRCNTADVIVLGVDVDPDLLASWERWLAPEVQPFFVKSLEDWPEGVPSPGPLPLELVDTYKVYRLTGPLETLWLDEPTFLGMPRSRRAELVRLQVEHRRGAVPTVRRWQEVLDARTLRAQADGHRFVWWPSLLGPPLHLERRSGRPHQPVTRPAPRAPPRRTSAIARLSAALRAETTSSEGAQSCHRGAFSHMPREVRNTFRGCPTLTTRGSSR